MSVRAEPTAEMSRKTIARCPCTPLWTVYTFCERTSASSGSGKEIAGSLKNKDDDEENDDMKTVKIACKQILAWQTEGR